MTDFTVQSRRCVCEVGPFAHRIHGNPKNQTGKHLDPRCPHSELYNSLVRFPAMHDRKRKARKTRHPIPRHVGN